MIYMSCGENVKTIFLLLLLLKQNVQYTQSQKKSDEFNSSKFPLYTLVSLKCNSFYLLRMFLVVDRVEIQGVIVCHDVLNCNCDEDSDLST